VNIVAIETATETVGVAVRTAAGVQAEFTLTGRRRHVESLTPALEHLLAQVDLPVGELNVIAVDLGPGLFTGLRVGVAAAKGLAQSLGIGVIGVTSTEVLVRAAAEAGHRGTILAAVDARRGEVFATVRELSQEGGSIGAELIPLGLLTPDDLVTALAQLGGRSIVACGDGAQRYAADLAAVPGLVGASPGLAFPPPMTLLHMAVRQLSEGLSPVDPLHVVPLYMRDADAKSNFARIAPAGG
jgi:tRNA threonylcarbamoyladenosine biosynthesis protein TsaB